MTTQPTTESAARSLDEVTVQEAMHEGVLRCPLWTPLREVARMMATYRVHSVVALGEGGEENGEPLLWGVVSDLDLVSAAATEDVEGRTAGGTAATELLKVAPTETLGRAAQIMREHGVSHLVVVEPESDRPVGMLSTLDLAAVIGGVAGPHEERGATRVDELMTTKVVSVTPDTPLKAVAGLLVEHRISGVPVVEDGRVVGVVSEADILAKERGPQQAPHGLVGWLVGDVMAETRAKLAARTAGEAMSSPAITIEAWRSPSSAAALMIEQGVKRLPVLKKAKLAGILTRADLVRAFIRSDAEIERDIRQTVILGSFWISPEQLEVRVRDGDVTLRGQVDAAIVAEVLPMEVQRVPGVLSVRSELTPRTGGWTGRRFRWLGRA